VDGRALGVAQSVASPQHLLGRPLRVHDEPGRHPVDRRHHAQRRVEVVEVVAGGRPLLARRPDAEPGRREHDGDLGRVAGGRVTARLCVRGVDSSREKLGARGGDSGGRPRRLGIHGDGPFRRPDLHSAHAVARERPRLVGADHARGAQRLHGAQPLHEHALVRQLAGAGRQGQGDRREQSLGHVCDQQADGEQCRLGGVQTGQDADRYERRRHDAADERDQPRDPAELALERAPVALHARGEQRDPAQLGAHARCEDDRLGLSARADRAAEDKVGRSQRVEARRLVARRSLHGHGLAGQRRHVDLDGAGDEPGVGGDPHAFFDQHQVARDEFGSRNARPGAVTDHPGSRRNVRTQRLHRPLGLPLLHEGEEGVQEDHEDDHDRERPSLRRRRQRGGDPQKQHQRVGELLEDLARQLGALAANEHVGPVDLQTTRGFRLGQPPQSRRRRRPADRMSSGCGDGGPRCSGTRRGSSRSSGTDGASASGPSTPERPGT
jgi:hypothetical protein